MSRSEHCLIADNRLALVIRAQARLSHVPDKEMIDRTTSAL